MKISIITVLNTINYGSVLQTFASQKYFEELGFDVEFVDYWRKDQRISAKIERVLFDKKSSLVKWLKKPIRDIIEIISIIVGTRRFRSFLITRVHLTKQKYSDFSELCANIPVADVYATGSDQMWNSGWNQGIERSFFLEYVPDGKKRIAFSTSIGKIKWDQSEADKVVPLLKKYDYITLREQSALELLKQYGIRGRLILDPTLLFDRKQWLEYLPALKCNKPYLLVYQLHQRHAQANFIDAVEKLANQRNLKIKRVTYSYSDRRMGEKIVLPEVFTFLALIRDAEFVVTDSFHGTAFSVNFNKQFAVIYPEHFSTRMDNLLTMTGMENRRYTSEMSLFDKDIDYEDINRILDKKRKEIKADFKNYFDINNVDSNI